MNYKIREELDVRKEASHLLNQLKVLSIKRLEKMFDPKDRLFCFKSIPDNGSIKNEGLSFRYSIITLLGLYKLQLYGDTTVINIREATENLIVQARRIDNIGDFGLLIWMLSLHCPEHLERLHSEVDIYTALHSYADARAAKTTELSWFLTGLSYMALKDIKTLLGLEELAVKTYKLIKENYGGHGIFRHQRLSGIRGKLRSRIGAFADQVYPIYALARFAQAYKNREALNIALQCGKAICAHQGPFGQWWWHYDAVTGYVVGRYPVFSVHQYGMAPMALFTLAEVAKDDFDGEVYKGLAWITGNNELTINMIDASQGVIWRSIHRSPYKRQLEIIWSLVKGHNNGTEPNDLKILYECRPYCFGWLLYAFAGKWDGNVR